MKLFIRKEFLRHFNNTNFIKKISNNIKTVQQIYIQCKQNKQTQN